MTTHRYAVSHSFSTRSPQHKQLALKKHALYPAPAIIEKSLLMSVQTSKGIIFIIRKSQIKLFMSLKSLSQVYFFAWTSRFCTSMNSSYISYIWQEFGFTEHTTTSKLLHQLYKIVLPLKTFEQCVDSQLKRIRYAFFTNPRNKLSKSVFSQFLALYIYMYLWRKNNCLYVCSYQPHVQTT